MLRYIFSLLVFCGFIALIPACNSDKKQAQSSNYSQILENDSIPPVIKNIVKAIVDNDPDLFAKQVAYPLERPYPLKDIKDEEDMEAYYSTIVDDSLRHVVSSSTPGDWVTFGWRGYSLKDGSYMWIDESLYAMNYVSEKEHVLMDSLSNIEINSLPEQLGTGWVPILTLASADGNKIYRIDKKEADNSENPDHYRLAIYDYKEIKKNVHEMPGILLEGNMDIEGSATIVSYLFPDNYGHVYVIYPDDPGTGKPTLTLPDGHEEELIKAYWYEIIQ